MEVQTDLQLSWSKQGYLKKAGKYFKYLWDDILKKKEILSPMVPI